MSGLQKHTTQVTGLKHNLQVVTVNGDDSLYSERLWSVTAECHTITSLRHVEFPKEIGKKENVRKDISSAALASYGKSAVYIYISILLHVTKPIICN
jgi:hypothetical protein